MCTPSRWLKGQYGEKVLLSGIMMTLDFDEIDKEFFFKLALKEKDEGKLTDVKVSDEVQAKGTKGEDNYIPKIPARVLTCFHATIPRQNIAAFYRRLSTNQIILIGYGNHIGSTNKEYSVTWADGSTSSIHLKKTASGDDFLNKPKLLDKFGNLQNPNQKKGFKY